LAGSILSETAGNQDVPSSIGESLVRTIPALLYAAIFTAHLTNNKKNHLVDTAASFCISLDMLL